MPALLTALVALVALVIGSAWFAARLSAYVRQTDRLRREAVAAEREWWMS